MSAISTPYGGSACPWTWSAGLGQTGMIGNGSVHITEDAAWLGAYLHEMTVFPKGKHDDQADSTAHFLDWFKRPFPNQGYYEWARQRAQAIEQRRKPQPTKTVWAIA